jgi:hypothetical protein
MDPDEVAAHRLVLTAAEWALLVRASGFAAPPGFEPAQADGPALREAARTLASRWVVTGQSDDSLDCRPVASIVANLAALAVPVAAVRVEVSVHDRGLRALCTIAGPLGASLFRLPDGGVELSMFPAEALGRELIRAVPDLPEVSAVDATIGAALNGRTGEPLTGRLPLAALDAPDDASPAGDGGGLVLTAGETALAVRVRQQTTGTLCAVVTGRGGDGMLVGSITWLATGHGWVGIRPDPDGTDRRMVALEPVARDDIGVWVAPFLAEILEVAGDRA